MARPESIPAPAIRRLSLYVRQLEDFHAAQQRTVSSRQLSDALGISDAQVRKDLAYFGQFGRPGIGYRVAELVPRMRRILGTDRDWNVALVGAGHIGHALLSYRGFQQRRFHVAAVFDASPEKIGQKIGTKPRRVIQPTSELGETIKRLNICLGIVAVPASAAQAIADDLVAVGVRGILNFAPIRLRVPAGVSLCAVDMAAQLEQLSFQLTSERT